MTAWRHAQRAVIVPAAISAHSTHPASIRSRISRNDALEFIVLCFPSVEQPTQAPTETPTQSPTETPTTAPSGEFTIFGRLVPNMRRMADKGTDVRLILVLYILQPRPRRHRRSNQRACPPPLPQVRQIKKRTSNRPSCLLPQFHLEWVTAPDGSTFIASDLSPDGECKQRRPRRPPQRRPPATPPPPRQSGRHDMDLFL